MVIVTFSVPDEVNDAFDNMFSDVNKSTVIADLMREAIKRACRKQASDEAVDAILARRSSAPARSANELARSRASSRP